MAPDDHTQLSGPPENALAGATPGFAGDDPLVGRILKGAYCLEGKVGEGGMGVVYRASQIALGRIVAVKMIPQDRKLPDNAVERFFREAKLLSQLQHPHIVSIIDFGTDADAMPFMVMEYLHGEPLDIFVKARRRLIPANILDIMEQLCSAIEAAHQKKVIHRDLKPSNVYLVHVTGSTRPSVKVLDFGLGKTLIKGSSELTREGMMMGTLCYSAPEQLGGVHVDSRADIYSLGAILYFLVAGRSPFLDDQKQGNLILQLARPPEPIDPTSLGAEKTRAVEAVIHKAMSPVTGDRYQSANELFADLSRVLGPDDTVTERGSASLVDVPTRIRPATPTAGPTALGGRMTRRRWLLGAGLASLGAAGGLGTWLYRRSRPLHGGATAPGVTDKEIVVGMSGPFNGPTAELGRGMQAGIETYFDKINDSGGVHGRHLQLIALDDRYEPDRTRKTMEELLEQYHVFAFLGNVGTPTAEVALPMATRNDRVFFGAFTGANLLRKVPPDPLVFNYRASYTEETAAIVTYLLDVRRLPPESIAVFAQKDGFGDAGFAGVRRALRTRNVSSDKILRVGYDRNSISVDPAIDAIVGARDKVKAIVMVATYKPAALFIKRIRLAGVDAVCTNVSFVDSEALAEELGELGPKFSSGVIVTQVVPHFDSGAAGIRRYRQHMKKYRPSATPGFVSLEGYLAANIFVEGLRAAGPALTTESLVAALESMQALDIGIGTTIHFDSSEHQASHKVWGSILNDKGEYRDLELE